MCDTIHLPPRPARGREPPPPPRDPGPRVARPAASYRRRHREDRPPYWCRGGKADPDTRSGLCAQRYRAAPVSMPFRSRVVRDCLDRGEDAGRRGCPAGRSVRRGPAGLAGDRGAGLGQRVGVLAAVVGAEEQLSRREDDTYVRLGAAAVTQVHGGQRFAGSHSTGHVALLVPPAGTRRVYPFGHRLVIASLIPNTRVGTYVPSPRPPTPRANGFLCRPARLLGHGILRIVPGNEGISGGVAPPGARRWRLVCHPGRQPAQTARPATHRRRLP